MSKSINTRIPCMILYHSRPFKSRDLAEGLTICRPNTDSLPISLFNPKTFRFIGNQMGNILSIISYIFSITSQIVSITSRINQCSSKLLAGCGNLLRGCRVAKMVWKSIENFDSKWKDAENHCTDDQYGKCLMWKIFEIMSSRYK